MIFEWTDLTYQQILAGNTTLYVFSACVLLIYLVLAAKYESLFLPLPVIFIIPLSLFSAMCGVSLKSGDVNIFTQIALFVLAGLTCKNAILIVEFARELETHGSDTINAAIEGARLRLRPVLMTSFAFIMGVMPLAFAVGAGAEMRRAMGVAVFAGMLGVTLFGLVLTQVFYVVFRAIEKVVARREVPIEQQARRLLPTEAQRSYCLKILTSVSPNVAKVPGSGSQASHSHGTWPRRRCSLDSNRKVHRG